MQENANRHALLLLTHFLYMLHVLQVQVLTAVKQLQGH